MKTCTLNEFLKEVEPWLDSDYIRKAYLDDKGNFVLLFHDGFRNVYEIDDCTKDQLKTVLEDLKSKGIIVQA